MKIKLEEGMSVLVFGNITIFDKRGSYQINISQLKLEGIGELQKRIEQLKKKLLEEGIKDVKVETVLSPPWTTDWMTDTGKEKLRAFGIAPPEGSSADKSVLFGKPKEYQGGIIIDHPEFEIVGDDDDASIHLERIVPVYKGVSGVAQRHQREYVYKLLEAVEVANHFMPLLAEKTQRVFGKP